MEKIKERYDNYPYNIALCLARLYNLQEAHSKMMLFEIEPNIPYKQHNLANLFLLTSKLSIEEVSKITGRKRASSVLILKRMLKNGILQKIRVQGDRKVYYTLSDKIRPRLNPKAIDNAFLKVTDCFSKDECQEYIRLSAKFAESIRSELSRLEKLREKFELASVMV